jgi:ketosteroid isomerase-like protein
MSQENVQIIRGIYEAFARGDVPAVLQALDAQIEWREADNFPYADGNPYLGSQASVEGVFMRLGAEWDGFAAQPDTLLDAGEHVVALGTYSGTYKTTGRQVRAQFAHVWTVAQGKVQKFQQYTDTKQFAEAVQG